jgi:hypothetical protein
VEFIKLFAIAGRAVDDARVLVAGITRDEFGTSIPMSVFGADGAKTIYLPRSEAESFAKAILKDAQLVDVDTLPQARLEDFSGVLSDVRFALVMAQKLIDGDQEEGDEEEEEKEKEKEKAA